MNSEVYAREDKYKINVHGSHYKFVKTIKNQLLLLAKAYTGVTFII